MNKAEILRENRDELTGLLDKQGFYIWAQELIDTAEDCTTFAFIFFDMDNFKLFNANYGFEKGDELLVSISKIIKNIFKDQLVAKFSGDHFVVCTNTTQIITSITEVRKQVKEIQKNINLELKAGVYVLDGESTDAVRCCDRARMACISIKKKYDVAYRFYDEELGGSLIRKQFIIDNLDEALKEGYIQVYYQPIVRSYTGDVCGWEALVRWIDPARGVVYPNEFISVLEEYRLIYKLDAYVIEQVIKNIATQSKAGSPGAVPVSINLSRIDFEALDIVPYIDELIARYGVNPKLVKFEITESVLMENPRFIQEQISRLRNKGYDVWMDDFGSGYSSLNVLKNFEFDLIKIDMEFLRGFDSSDDGKIIIKHMVSMIKNLGFHTLAEGVETTEQMEFLQDIGCELIQGYLIGRPMPFEEGLGMIAKNGLRFESLFDREFYNDIGRIDVLKQNPLDGMDRVLNSKRLPLAIGVVKDGNWKFVYANDRYKQEIKVFGHETLDIAEKMINQNGWSWIQRNEFWEICAISKETKRTESIQFVENGKIYNMKVHHITSDEETNSAAYLVSIRGYSIHSNESLENKTSVISKYLFSLYECIDIFGLNVDFYENLYLVNSKLHIKDKDNIPKNVIKEIAKQCIYKDDRELYLKFMNLDDVEQRLEAEKNGIKVAFFRIKDSLNKYVWKKVTIRVVRYLELEVLLSCVSEATSEISDYLDKLRYEERENLYSKQTIAGKHIEDYAFENILKLLPVGVFWKDKERRFVGANQMFLDYYGLKSQESIRGKTDEDMGWHINPEPFMKDELAVINEGKVIKNVQGECIVQGVVRKIVASKQPFYVDGKIMGLIGFFSDVTEQLEEKEKLELLSNTDQLTKLLNRRAFDNIIQKYVAQYDKDCTDFVMVLIDVDKFKKINDMYGHDFGDKVLIKSAEIIRNITSNNSVAFRIGGDEFAILHQYKSNTEIKSIEQELQIKFAEIERIAGFDIKVRVSIGYSTYSQYKDVHILFNNADKSMYEDKAKHKK